MRVGFIGAGLMGAGMVRNLAATGHEVHLYARTAEKARSLPAVGTRSVAQAVDGADVACLSVTDSEDVRQVVGQILEALAPPRLLVDTSTIAPAVARDLGEALGGHGIAYMDCPVSGGPPGAEAGTLAVMCGGDGEALRMAAPVLDAIGDPAKRVHCGPIGAGLVAKLVNNLLVAVIAAGTAEAFGIGQRAGVPPEILRQVVMASSGNSWQLENLFPRVLAGDHKPGFRARDLRKDLRHARDMAGAQLPIGDAAIEQYADLPGELDYGAVARAFMELPEDA